MKIIFLKLLSSVRYFNPPEIVIRYSHVPFKITIRRYAYFMVKVFILTIAERKL